MIVCSSRPIAYDLLTKFQGKYPEWFIEKKSPDGGYLMDPNHDSNGNCDAADAFRYLATTFEMIKEELYEEDMNRYLDEIEYYGPDNAGPTGY